MKNLLQSRDRWKERKKYDEKRIAQNFNFNLLYV